MAGKRKCPLCGSTKTVKPFIVDIALSVAGKTSCAMCGNEIKK